MASQIKKLAEYYHVANQYRQAWFSTRYRLVIAALVAIGLLLVYNHLQNAYTLAGKPAQVLIAQQAFLLYEKLFNWFIAGMFFGILSSALLFEGEFLIGVWKVLRHVEKGAEQEITALGKKPKRITRPKTR